MLSGCISHPLSATGMGRGMCLTSPSLPSHHPPQEFHPTFIAPENHLLSLVLEAPLATAPYAGCSSPNIQSPWNPQNSDCTSDYGSCTSIGEADAIRNANASASHTSLRQDSTGDRNAMQENSRFENDNKDAFRLRSKYQRLKDVFVIGTPCRVCDDTATGFHFNVECCNGCKTFFRRVITENRTYSCKAYGNCEIDKDRRCSCRCCRYNKCLRVGMDASEICAERRERKSRIAPNAAEDHEQSSDHLVNLLMGKEVKFYALLTSRSTPIHESIDAALRADKIFHDVSKYANAPMGPSDQHNFSTWNAKILSSIAEWAKSFELFCSLSPSDQRRLYTHSALSNLFICEAWYTPAKYSDRIVFPDGHSEYRTVAMGA
ncbi:hypothetical protein PMAYCL1PPCAC_16968, partial [Pristionchus mayeri]